MENVFSKRCQSACDFFDDLAILRKCRGRRDQDQGNRFLHGCRDQGSRRRSPGFCRDGFAGAGRPGGRSRDAPAGAGRGRFDRLPAQSGRAAAEIAPQQHHRPDRCGHSQSVLHGGLAHGRGHRLCARPAGHSLQHRRGPRAGSHVSAAHAGRTRQRRHSGAIPASGRTNRRVHDRLPAGADRPRPARRRPRLRAAGQ